MRRLARNQNGMASIIIVTVIISVTTLITISFSSLVRREQRQALDQQLSAQARYAGESEINQKVALFRQDPGLLASSDGCEEEPAPTFSDVSGNSDSEEIQTTCVVVNTAPGPIVVDKLPVNESKIYWIDPAENMENLVIAWQNPETVAGNQCLSTGYNVLPQSLSSNQIGMIRFDLARVGAEGSPFTRDSLKGSLFGGVLYPRQGGNGTTGYITDSSQQPVITGRCGDTLPAGFDTSDLDSQFNGPYAYTIIQMGNNRDRYILRARSIYKETRPLVLGYNSEGDVITFQDSQILIEATTRVSDVVQRVQVRVPAATPPKDILPDHAIHVTNGGVCKLVETEPNSTSNGC